MLPAEKPTLVVEVNVQDIFSTNSSTSNSGVEENYQITRSTWKSWFTTWLNLLDPNIPAAEVYEVTLRLTDDREIQHLNAQYRKLDKPTDVLAFAALEVDFPVTLDKLSLSEPLYLGDLIISIETASKQAKQQQHSLTTELGWLAAHGFLHLLGWDHLDEESLKAMLLQQEILLKAVGIITKERLAID